MILDKITADKKLRRMAMEVAERNHRAGSLVLIGIRDNGAVIARKISGYLKDVFKGKIEVLSLGIDKKNPSEIELSKKVDFNGATILLIDDVANSGRTMLYALKPLLQFTPAGIQTLALVERTHKRFPVHVDFVGLSVSTTRDETIIVEVAGDEVNGVFFKEQ